MAAILDLESGLDEKELKEIRELVKKANRGLLRKPDLKAQYILGGKFYH